MPTATPVAKEGALNGTTPVTILGAPGASNQRVVAGISIHNRDTASVTVTLRKDKGGTETVLTIKDLDPGDTLEYEKRVVLDATDETLEAVLAGAITSANPDYDVAAVEYAP